MTTNEFYYLLLVLGAFGAFAIGISLAMFQYKAWRRRQPATVAVRHNDLDGAQRAGRLADAA